MGLSAAPAQVSTQHAFFFFFSQFKVISIAHTERIKGAPASLLKESERMPYLISQGTPMLYWWLSQKPVPTPYTT
jgi:hypothetical protein